MLTYHLSIKTKVENEATELNDYLYPHEILINSSFKLTSKITNTGDKKFPGGKIKRIKVSFFPGGEYLYWPLDPPLEIPEILQEASATRSRSLNLLSQPGIFHILFQISLDKEGEILYFEDPSKKGRSREYKSRLYVAVHRRQVEIVALLHQILSNLKKE